MILECPSCLARYLVQAGIFAQGPRQVRCARCKHSWRAELPLNIEVFVPEPAFEPAPVPVPAFSSSPPSSMPGAIPSPGPSLAETVVANLPAVIKNWKGRRYIAHAAGAVVFVVLFVLWPILDRQQIAEVIPALQGIYESIGLHIQTTGRGLIFDQVKSELRYDGGTMRLYVDGVVHNTMSELHFIPDIKASALGVDRKVIQSWMVDAPADTVAPGGDVPFHTEVNVSSAQTIEDVYLEFSTQDAKGKDAKQPE